MNTNGVNGNPKALSAPFGERELKLCCAEELADCGIEALKLCADLGHRFFGEECKDNEHYGGLWLLWLLMVVVIVVVVIIVGLMIMCDICV